MRERLKAKEEGVRAWDSWMASPMQWTWTWVNFRRWWGTERPGVLQSMGSQSQTWLNNHNNNHLYKIDDKYRIRDDPWNMYREGKSGRNPRKEQFLIYINSWLPCTLILKNSKEAVLIAKCALKESIMETSSAAFYQCITITNICVW